MPNVDYENLNKHRQGFDLDRGFMVGEVAARIRIHHDTSYARQSWAIAEVWSAATLSWNEAASYHYGEWADETGRENGMTTGMVEAFDELEARVRALLAA